LKSARVGLFLALLSASAAALAAPGLLIVQAKFSSKDKRFMPGLNTDIATYISHEFDENGRLVPVVYSKTDPIFQAAITSGRLKDVPDVPTPREVFNTARTLGAEYILVVEPTGAGKSVKAKVRLYLDGREIWKDEQEMSVSTQESVNPGDTAKSLARTFVLRLNAQPFHTLPDRPKTAPPVLQPGQTPVVTVTPPAKAAKPEISNADLKKKVDDLILANKPDSAILLMRDAVDAAPLDLDRRMALIDLLANTNPTAAAEEANRAAILMPEKIDLRLRAARAWIKAGNPDEAQKELNEAVARDPNGPSTRLLLAELSLEQLQPGKAIAHLDEAIKQQDSSQARFLRALCRSLLGGVDGMQIDLAQADKLEPVKSDSETMRRYSLAADITDRTLTQDGSDVRSMLTKIVVKPKDQGLKDQFEQTLRLIQARIELLTLIPVPPAAKPANDRRILALKLMAQSLSDIENYSKSPDEDTIADATFNLGESLKQLAAAHN
jgi:tetratricopeptide (TPR) repeat protein